MNKIVIIFIISYFIFINNVYASVNTIKGYITGSYPSYIEFTTNYKDQKEVYEINFESLEIDNLINKYCSYDNDKECVIEYEINDKDPKSINHIISVNGFSTEQKLLNKDDLVGPKMFGIQLGMSYNQIKNAIKKYDLKEFKLQQTLSGGPGYYFVKGNDPDLYYFNIAFNKNGYAERIEISNRIFNNEDLCSKQFLNQFIKHNNIPSLYEETKYGEFGNYSGTYTHYIYSDDKTYKLKIDCYNIILEKINTKKFNFE